MKNIILIFAIGIVFLFGLQNVFAQSQVVYSVQLEINKNDTVILKNISADYGIISHFPQQVTGYSIKVVSNEGKELFNANLGVSFTMILDPVGVVKMNRTFVSARVPYFENARIISVYHSDKQIFSLDLNRDLCDNNDVCDIGENRYNCQDCVEKKTTTTTTESLEGFPDIYIIIIVLIAAVIVIIIAMFIFSRKGRTQKQKPQQWLSPYPQYR
jgi:cell division protein FtsL